MPPAKSTRKTTVSVKDNDRQPFKLLRNLMLQPSFRRNYLFGCLAILLVTTVFWAVLSAQLQNSNADQLSDPALFSNWVTFHGATFPGAHTFLLKWPIFWLIGLVGISHGSLLVATVLVVLLTVGALTAVLYKIERRPLVFGTICLALALVLLLIPTQPYAGGILPVNMAMLTTRNLEYIVYLSALVLFVRSARLRSREFLGGAILLSLLVASDKLFLSLSVGGALLALVVYSLAHNWELVTFSVRWLIGSILAAVGSFVALLIISGLHITHFANEAGASPYSLALSAKNLVLGGIYAVLGLLTNTGANPVYDSTIAKQLPAHLASRLFSLSGLAHVLAAGVLLYALLFVWRLVWPSIKTGARSTAKTSTALQLSFALLWSTVAAVGVFVVTNHYYAVDARYLTISFFALAVTAATGLRQIKWQHSEKLLLAGGILSVGIIISCFAAYGTFTHQKVALTPDIQRNNLVSQALEHHKVDVLVGDYWRVLPIKQVSGNRINALPLAGCTQARDTLTSTVWQPDLSKHSFAYLISFDSSLTGFPSCSLPQVTKLYGRPNAVQVTSGTLANPKEALLFYDHGAHKPTSAPKQAPAPSTVLPIALDDLTGTSCDAPTIINVVAHEDDDLLFLSPDLLHDVQAKHCVRTIFLTAGDNGNGKFYWLNRQLGAEAAYDSMLGTKNVWEQQTVQLANQEYVTVASPSGNSKISLIFMNLPDGNLQGQGFPASHNESLAKLQSGTITNIQTVDGQSNYTAPQLVAALASLMHTYEPAQIRTQADVPSAKYPDHSDHIATGKFTESAASAYDQEQFADNVTIPVVRYIGYPIHSYTNNVSGTDLAQKEAAFFAYAQFDGSVCNKVAMCAQTSTYGSYLPRQYQESANQP